MFSCTCIHLRHHTMQAPTQWKRSVLFLIISVPANILCLKCYVGKDDTRMPDEIDAEPGEYCVYTFMKPCEFKQYADVDMFRKMNKFRKEWCRYINNRYYVCICNSKELCNGNLSFIKELWKNANVNKTILQCVSNHLENITSLIPTTTTATTTTTAITTTTTSHTTAPSTTTVTTTLATEKLVTTAEPTQATNAPAATAASTTATSVNGTTTDATIVTSAAANALTQSNTSTAEHVERDSENDTALELNATRVSTTTSTIMASTTTIAHLAGKASGLPTKTEPKKNKSTTASTQKSERVSSSSESGKEKHKQSTYSTKRDMVAGNKKKEALHMSDEPEVPSSFFAFGILAIVAAVLLCLVLPVVAGYLIAKKRRRNGKPENPESGAMPTGSRESVKNAAVPQTKAPEPSKAKASEQPEVKSQEAIQKDQPKNQSKEPVNAGSAEKGSAAKAENPEPQSL